VDKVANHTAATLFYDASSVMKPTLSECRKITLHSVLGLAFRHIMEFLIGWMMNQHVKHSYEWPFL
jgi:hypothetical protein